MTGQKDKIISGVLNVKINCKNKLEITKLAVTPNAVYFFATCHLGTCKLPAELLTSKIICNHMIM